MLIPTPLYFDAQGRPVTTPDKAVTTQIGNIRTRKSQAAQILIRGVWTNLPQTS